MQRQRHGVMLIYMPCTEETNFAPELAERDTGYHLSVLPE